MRLFNRPYQYVKYFAFLFLVNFGFYQLLAQSPEKELRVKAFTLHQYNQIVEWENEAKSQKLIIGIYDFPALKEKLDVLNTLGAEGSQQVMFQNVAPGEPYDVDYLVVNEVDLPTLQLLATNRQNTCEMLLVFDKEKKLVFNNALKNLGFSPVLIPGMNSFLQESDERNKENSTYFFTAYYLPQDSIDVLSDHWPTCLPKLKRNFQQTLEQSDHNDFEDAYMALLEELILGNQSKFDSLLRIRRILSNQTNDFLAEKKKVELALLDVHEASTIKENKLRQLEAELTTIEFEKQKLQALKRKLDQELLARKQMIQAHEKSISQNLQKIRKDSTNLAQLNEEIILKKVQTDKLSAVLKDKNKIILGFTIAGIVVMILSFLLLIAYRNQRNLSSNLAIQKNEVISQKNLLETQHTEITHQHELLSEKNREITESITYAKRIQEAILPPTRLIKEQLRNSFILYKPKDIVAGDFYWMETKGDWVFYAAADCTGHGVPGAMVSVICSNALNRSVNEFNLSEPGKILDKTLELVQERFAKSEEDVKDGMDLALCAFNSKTNELKYAGANNPLWIVTTHSHKELVNPKTFEVNGKKLLEIKPTKQAIGKNPEPISFETHTIQLLSGDTVYTFSDGYADQFGGPKGKKLKYKPFKEMLITISDKPLDEQKQILSENFEAWRGELEQVDDVCVIGLRV